MREDRLVSGLAVILGLAGEGLLLWFLDSLPLWAQLCLYVPVGAALLFGVFLLVRDGLRARRRRRPTAPTSDRRSP